MSAFNLQLDPGPASITCGGWSVRTYMKSSLIVVGEVGVGVIGVGCLLGICEWVRILANLAGIRELGLFRRLGRCLLVSVVRLRTDKEASFVGVGVELESGSWSAWLFLSWIWPRYKHILKHAWETTTYYSVLLLVPLLTYLYGQSSVLARILLRQYCAASKISAGVRFAKVSDKGHSRRSAKSSGCVCVIFLSGESPPDLSDRVRWWYRDSWCDWDHPPHLSSDRHNNNNKTKLLNTWNSHSLTHLSSPFTSLQLCQHPWTCLMFPWSTDHHVGSFTCSNL